MALLFEAGAGHRIYHYGDSTIFDMRLLGELYRPTVALLGCTQPVELLLDVPGPGRFLTGEMTPDEAARVAEMLGVSIAVACHYISRTEEVDEFLELVGHHDTSGSRAAVGPEVGDTLVLDGQNWRLERPQVALHGEED
jgi:L-ascorbate metabolism protein UlaG (beta-lactamase superfamily)